MEQKRKHETLVTRLRTTCQRADQSGDRNDYTLTNHTVWMLAVKLDAIGEALAYLIDKKHTKRKVAKLKKQIKRSKKNGGYLGDGGF